MFMSESCRLNLAIGWGRGRAGGVYKDKTCTGKMATAVTFYKMADLDPISHSLTLTRINTHSHCPPPLPGDNPSPPLPVPLVPRHPVGSLENES